jgi:hypothetical protein
LNEPAGEACCIGRLQGTPEARTDEERDRKTRAPLSLTLPKGCGASARVGRFLVESGWRSRMSLNSPWPGPAEVFGVPSLEAVDIVSGDYEWGALAESKVSFLTHCPSNKDFIARCHKMGVQCFPYITLSFGLAEVVPSGTMVVQPPPPEPFYLGINFGTAGFWALDSNGKPQFMFPTDGTGLTPVKIANQPALYATCPNVEAYQQKVVKWVETLMQGGADGVFIDAIPNGIGSTPAQPNPVISPCFGEALGQHAHIYTYNPNDFNAGKTAQKNAFTLFLKRVREVVLRHGGKVLGNTGMHFDLSPGPVGTNILRFGNMDLFTENGVLPYLDADLLEQFFDLSASSIQTPNGTVTIQRVWSGYWYPYIRAIQGVLNKPQFRGKQVLVIPPNPKIISQVQQCIPSNFACTVREYQFLTYVASRLAGFIRFVGPLSYSGYNAVLSHSNCVLNFDDVYTDLARIRLGPPTTEIISVNSILFYRVFENGMVVLNSDMNSDFKLRISGPENLNQANAPFPTTKLFDLFDLSVAPNAYRLKIIDIGNIGGLLAIPPLSGRVYLFAADTSYLLA